MLYHVEGNFCTIFLVNAIIYLVKVQSRMALNEPYNCYNPSTTSRKVKLCSRKEDEYLSNPINLGTGLSLFLKVAWKP